MKARKILSNMTLEEKISLLCGVNSMHTAGYPNHGVKEVTMSDGPSGLRDASKTFNATHFPCLAALGATWDTEIAEKMGEGIGKDCIKRGIDVILGPGTNIKRNMLCGRNFEYISEDPVLSGNIAAGYIQGGESLGLGTCIKHFAANSIETDRQEVNAEIDERTLRELYLKPFEIAIKKANPKMVMCAYNKVNAIWCGENKYLLTEVLREDWGYEGVMISDWNAVHNPARSVEAGLDLTMPPRQNFNEELLEALKQGTLTEEAIDKAALHMIHLALQVAPKKDINYNRDEQHTLAQTIAAESIVLLKNEQNLLPINSKQYKKIAVFGSYAQNPQRGGQGSAEVYPDETYIDSPLKELQKKLPGTEIVYRELYHKNHTSETMLWTFPIEQMVEDADLCIFFAGTKDGEETEQFDRLSPYIDPNVGFFINSCKMMNKPVVLVLQTGGAVILDKNAAKSDSIVEMWLSGEGGGKAIADVLCGYTNPSGKLSETFPACMRQDLMYTGDLKLSYNEKLDIGYRYYDKHPQEIAYPFGHGLSYTEFSYSGLSLCQEKEGIKVQFTVKNVGKVAGKETPQLYVGIEDSVVTRPIKELKDFCKVTLQPGEEKTVSFYIPEENLGYFNTMLHRFVTEEGTYVISVGASARDIRLKGTLYYTCPVPYTVENKEKTMVG